MIKFDYHNVIKGDLYVKKSIDNRCGWREQCSGA